MKRRFPRGRGVRRRMKEEWISMVVRKKKHVLDLLEWLDFGSAKGVIFECGNVLNLFSFHQQKGKRWTIVRLLMEHEL